MSEPDLTGFWDTNFGLPKVQKNGDYKDFFVRELKSELKKRKLPITGVKSTLVNRLKTEDSWGYGMLTVPELKNRMKSEGLDVSGDKSTLKGRMKAKLRTRGYEFLPINDLRQLCRERGLNLPKKNSTGQKSTLMGRLSQADAAKVKASTFSYSPTPSPSTDSSPVVMTVIGGVIAFMLVLGCIDLMDTDDDSYSSSSGGSSGSSSSTPCEQLKDVWCYSYSLDMCVYHDSSSNVVYYQEAHWYGC